MIQPERAAVTPRVMWPETGDAVPIDEVFHRMVGKSTGAIEIVGGYGSGKTTALRHLAAEAPEGRDIAWLDDAKPEEVKSQKRERWVVYTSTAHMATITGSSFPLAGWGADDRIEYLLAKYPEQCQSVIVRLSAADCSGMGDGPILWRIVLDEMAEHESVDSVDGAISRRLKRALPERRQRCLAEEYCWTLLTLQDLRSEEIIRRLKKRCSQDTLCLLHVPRVQLLLATEYLVVSLDGSRKQFRSLTRKRSLAGLAAGRSEPKGVASEPLPLPLALVRNTARRIAESRTAISCLQGILSGDAVRLQPMAASILHAFGRGWLPARRPGLCLSSAHLQRAAWPGIDLSDLTINLANFTASDLSRARLDRAQARATQFREASLAESSLAQIWARNAYFNRADLTRADLQEAQLRNAHLRGAVLDEANLERADLQSTDLRGASLAGANLNRARLSDSDIAGADFSSANLEQADLHGLDLRVAAFDGACLARADLGQCNLEEMQLVGVDFTGATLMLALLSDSAMVGAILREANLTGAGLAGIEWEYADLRFANFQGATFHMGTTRSGLVNSPFASEGTRTGFYTDEFDEQSYQAPEQIRKANLCGADLRGARVNGVDFYLVDLRGAKYDADQLEHFRKCRAILGIRE
jgi:uncharacterized protein YjbI with pentapeptide repeats